MHTEMHTRAGGRQLYLLHICGQRCVVRCDTIHSVHAAARGVYLPHLRHTPRRRVTRVRAALALAPAAATVRRQARNPSAPAPAHTTASYPPARYGMGVAFFRTCRCCCCQTQRPPPPPPPPRSRRRSHRRRRNWRTPRRTNATHDAPHCQKKSGALTPYMQD
jgi:hypothetical protein